MKKWYMNMYNFRYCKYMNWSCFTSNSPSIRMGWVSQTPAARPCPKIMASPNLPVNTLDQSSNNLNVKLNIQLPFTYISMYNINVFNLKDDILKPCYF